MLRDKAHLVGSKGSLAVKSPPVGKDSHSWECLFPPVTPKQSKEYNTIQTVIMPDSHYVKH